MIYRIGVDLGGTNIAAGVINEQNEIVSKLSVPTNTDPTFEGICRNINGLCLRLLREYPDAVTVGIGSPGIANCETGIVERWSNLKLENAPLVERVREKVGLPVYLENDANAAALGEYAVGAGRGTDNFMLITLGTGIGCGTVLGGKIYQGKNHAAFEAGHMVIDRHGLPCTCGRRGCFEMYASASALCREAEKAAKAHPESLLAGGKIDGRAVFAAAAQKDSTAQAVIAEYIEDLACGVTNMINLLQPEVLCIGGGISGAGDALLDPLRELAAKDVHAKDAAFKTQIKLAVLGNDAGIIGAALLPLYI